MIGLINTIVDGVDFTVSLSLVVCNGLAYIINLVVSLSLITSHRVLKSISNRFVRLINFSISVSFVISNHFVLSGILVGDTVVSICDLLISIGFIFSNRLISIFFITDNSLINGNKPVLNLLFIFIYHTALEVKATIKATYLSGHAIIVTINYSPLIRNLLINIRGICFGSNQPCMVFDTRGVGSNQPCMVFDARGVSSNQPCMIFDTRGVG